MGPSQPHRILVAVSGGIAAYKVPELVRALRRAGHEVRCVLTASAERFVTPLVLQTLSGARVRSDLFDAEAESEIDHIRLADWADVVVLAPATANRLAKLRQGIADDLVSTVLLATRAPLVIAPAMNVNMWQHPATQENVAVLRERGAHFIGPEAGELACGWEGEGRLSPPEQIAAAAEAVLTPASMQGLGVLVSAGGTVEAIDSVRTLTNRSSGKMGFAIAAEAARRGARVVLVAAPTSLETPAGVDRVDVESALQMREAVLAALPATDVVIKSAAVADFRPKDTHERKIKKESLEPGAGITLQLVPNPDILAEICQQKGERVVVGFAAESHDVVEAARRKLERKGCDLLVANDISRADAGFNVDTNAVLFVWPGGEVEELPLLSKSEVAAQLLDRVEKIRGGRE